MLEIMGGVMESSGRSGEFLRMSSTGQSQSKNDQAASSGLNQKVPHLVYS
jgi:hypothetical protein